MMNVLATRKGRMFEGVIGSAEASRAKIIAPSRAMTKDVAILKYSTTHAPLPSLARRGAITQLASTHLTSVDWPLPPSRQR